MIVLIWYNLYWAGFVYLFLNVLPWIYLKIFTYLVLNMSSKFLKIDLLFLLTLFKFFLFNFKILFWAWFLFAFLFFLFLFQCKFFLILKIKRIIHVNYIFLERYFSIFFPEFFFIMFICICSELNYLLINWKLFFNRMTCMSIVDFQAVKILNRLLLLQIVFLKWFKLLKPYLINIAFLMCAVSSWSNWWSTQRKNLRIFVIIVLFDVWIIILV